MLCHARSLIAHGYNSKHRQNLITIENNGGSDLFPGRAGNRSTVFPQKGLARPSPTRITTPCGQAPLPSVVLRRASLSPSILALRISGFHRLPARAADSTTSTPHPSRLRARNTRVRSRSATEMDPPHLALHILTQVRAVFSCGACWKLTLPPSSDRWWGHCHQSVLRVSDKRVFRVPRAAHRRSVGYGPTCIVESQAGMTVRESSLCTGH